MAMMFRSAGDLFNRAAANSQNTEQYYGQLQGLLGPSGMAHWGAGATEAAIRGGLNNRAGNQMMANYFAHNPATYYGGADWVRQLGI